MSKDSKNTGSLSSSKLSSCSLNDLNASVKPKPIDRKLTRETRSLTRLDSRTSTREIEHLTITTATDVEQREKQHIAAKLFAEREALKAKSKLSPATSLSTVIEARTPPGSDEDDTVTQGACAIISKTVANQPL